MKVFILEALSVKGKHYDAGTTADFAEEEAKTVLTSGRARRATDADEKDSAAARARSETLARTQSDNDARARETAADIAKKAEMDRIAREKLEAEASRKPSGR